MKFRFFKGAIRFARSAYQDPDFKEVKVFNSQGKILALGNKKGMYLL